MTFEEVKLFLCLQCPDLERLADWTYLARRAPGTSRVCQIRGTRTRPFVIITYDNEGAPRTIMFSHHHERVGCRIHLDLDVSFLDAITQWAQAQAPSGGPSPADGSARSIPLQSQASDPSQGFSERTRASHAKRAAPRRGR